MSDIAKLGFSVDTSGLKRGEQALDNFAKTGESTEKRTDKSSKKIVDDYQDIEKAVGKTASEVVAAERKMAKAQKEAEKQLRKRSRSLGQAGIQFQQFIGQVQGGQGVLLALSQQGADLGIVMDRALLGSIIGISASIAGLLLPQLFKTKDAMQLVEDANKELSDSFEESAEGVDVLSKSLLKLAKRNEGLAKLQLSVAVADAEKLIKVSAEGIEQALDDAFGMTTESVLRGFSANLRDSALKTTGSMDDVEKALAKGNIAFITNGAALSDTARVIAAKFDITRAQAVELGVAMSDVFEDQSVLNIKKFETVFTELNSSIGGSNEDFDKLGKSLLPLLKSTSDGVDKVTLFRKAFGDISKALAEADGSVNNSKDVIAGLTQGLEGQIIALRDGEKAAVEFGIKNRLLAEGIKEIPASLQASIDEYFRLKDATKDVTNNQDSALASFEKTILALEVQRQQLIMTADEFEIYTAKMKAIAAGATPEMITSIENAIKANQKLRKELGQDKESKNASKDFDKLTKQIEGFGGAWTKTGSVIVDAFGDISDALNDYMGQLKELDSFQASIDESRKKEGADHVALNQLQAQVNHERVSAELSGMKSLSKAGESLFAEKSAAAKAFAALNKIITIAEIALSFQKMTVGTTEAGVHVANEGTKQSANALTAITAAFAAPFPIGFVAGAAMIGVMASLIGGIAGGGGGSVDMTEQRQNTQGTGTVLGSDEKSASILESQERFEDIQIDQLAELRGIKDSLNNVASGIALVTRDLIASRGLGEFGGDLSKTGASQSSLGKLLSGESFGLDIGGLGGKLVDAIFGSTKKKVTDSGIRFVSKSLGDILEGGILQADQFFDIEKTKKKFFGLSKKVSTSTEFQSLDSSFNEGISAIFKDIGDVVLQSAALLGFETVTVMTKSFKDVDFSEFGDEAFRGFETVFTETEVGLKEALSKFQIDIGKVSLEGLSGEEVEQELQAIFSKQADLIAEFLVPSIDEYQKIGEGLFDTLTRVTQEQVIFNDTIKVMGFNLSELSNVMQIDVAQSIIDLTGGLENFSDLTNSFIDEFFTDAEKFTMLEDSLSEAFDSLGLSMVGSKEDFRALVEGLDLTTESGQELFAALLQISPAFAEYTDQIEEQVGGMANLAAAAENAFSMLEKAVQLDKQRAAANLDIAREAHNAELSRIDDLRTALEDENQLRNNNLSTAEDMLNNAFNSEMDRIRTGASEQIALIQSNSAARINSLNSEKTAINATATSMRSLVNSINSSLGLSKGTNLIAALASARTGDFSKAQALDISGLSKIGSGGFSSAEDLAVQQALNKNRLKAIGDLAQTELTSAEAMLAAIDRQVEATKSSTEQQVQSIQEQSELQIKELQDQLNTLLGIDDNVLGLDEAIKQFQEAQKAVDELGYQQEVERLDMLVKSADDVFALHEQAYADELERLDAILFDNEELLNAALGINTSVLSVAEAITSLSGALSAIASSSTASIPSSPLTLLGGTGGSAGSESAQQEEVKNELRKTREDNEMFQREIVKNTKQTARILQRLDMNGIETRSEP